MGDLDTFNGMHMYLNVSLLILSYLMILFITPEWEILYLTMFIWKLELLVTLQIVILYLKKIK